MKHKIRVLLVTTIYKILAKFQQKGYVFDEILLNIWKYFYFCGLSVKLLL